MSFPPFVPTHTKDQTRPESKTLSSTRELKARLYEPLIKLFSWIETSVAHSALAFFLMAGAIFVVTPATAQNTSSSVSGTIVDPSGAVLPNATISVRNDATGQILSATSDQ